MDFGDGQMKGRFKLRFMLTAVATAVFLLFFLPACSSVNILTAANKVSLLVSYHPVIH